ncbi:hypothetical protein LCGC14_2151080 [marine sediment metagenome]|uniref:ABC transporter domain-containing protein n=1 Tax=marine sediment metagenome TaxID=412755 RepID=A0A0F9GRW8_9ZZZZ
MSTKKVPNKNNEIVVEATKVWESFRIYHHKNYTIKDVLVRLKKSAYEEFWALKDVSFKVKRGETLGIIGENGSGKSTLLKCITGILPPTKGQVKVKGRISPLLELGAGFHPELSGKENIYINGAILGLTKKQIDEKFDEIVAFSELEKFIDNQVKFYSTGMYVRLGFAIAVFSEPDILIIDEILSVGDERFKKKSFDKMKQLQAQGKTIILVTHDMGTASKFCDRLIRLEKGRMKRAGKPKKIITDYVDSVIETEDFTEKGSKEIILTNVKLLSGNGQEIRKLRPGDQLTISIDYEAKQEVNDPVFAISILDNIGNNIFGTNTKLQNVATSIVTGKGNVSFKLNNLPMLTSKFYVTVAVHSDDGHNYHWIDRYTSFEVESKNNYLGLVYIPVECRIEKDKQPIVRKEKIPQKTKMKSKI